MNTINLGYNDGDAEFDSHGNAQQLLADVSILVGMPVLKLIARNRDMPVDDVTTSDVAEFVQAALNSLYEDLDADGFFEEES